MNLWEQLYHAGDGAPPGDRWARVLYHGARVGLAVLLAVLTYTLFPAAPAAEVPVYEVGSVAAENVIAPFAFRVRKEQTQLERERQQIARAVEPVFLYTPDSLAAARRELREFREAVTAALEGVAARQRVAAVQQAAARLGMQLEPAEAAVLADPTQREQVLAAVTRAINQWLAEGVAPGGALDTVIGAVELRRGGEVQRVPVDSVSTFAQLVARARRAAGGAIAPGADGVVRRLLAEFFHPTIVLDPIETQRVRTEAQESISPYRYEVRAGEKIVGAHEVVGRAEHEKLRALQQEIQTRRAGSGLFGRRFGAVLFNFLVIAIFGVALFLYRPQLYRSLRILALFAMVFMLVVVFAAIIAHGPDTVHPELVPIALAAIIISVLFDPRISLIAAMILAVLIGGQSAFRGTNALFLNLIGGVAAAFSVRVLRRRNQALYSILTIAAAYLLSAFAIGLTLGWQLQEIARSAMWGGFNAVVSVALGMILLPIAEEFTGIDTDLKLLEWSDLNRDLMRRLSLEAPGTYAHTMAIANLAEAAANGIGANGLLARVGAYYHDIGKLRKPQYFVENQPKGRNPHDKLKPSTSASIIRNHVQEGLELAEKYRVPRAVRAFITEHHGTGQISYFLEKAKERDGPVGNPGEFAYPGPLPRSAETAIVMLADGVEAAARVLQDPTPQRIRDVVDHIVRMRMEQGQLREAPLTLKQLEQIKEQFARVLIGMYHNRIDYPASGGGVTAEFASV